MASLFTGQHVDAHKVYFGSAPDGTATAYASELSDNWVMLAEALRDAGYANYGFVTNPNVAPGSGMDQGFAPGNYIYELCVSAERVTRAALERSVKLPQPFFMYLHYMDPHIPYDPPATYLETFGDPPILSNADTLALDSGNQLNYLLDLFRQSLDSSRLREFEPMSRAGRLAMRLRYEGECRYVDDQVAFLVDTVRTRFPNTIFVITADHGEQFWEHGGMGHGMTLYEESIHVPLILHGPGIAPANIREPVSTVGLFKTLSSFLSLQTKAHPVGLNLLDSIPVRHPVFSRTCGPEPGLPVDLESIRMGQDKLIVDRRKGQCALYNIGDDPRETEGVQDGESPAMEELLSILKNHDANTADIAASVVGTSTRPDMQEAREQLDALGYVGILEK